LQSSYYTILTGISVPLVNVGQVLDPMYLTPDYSLLTGTDYAGNIEYSFSNDLGDYQFDLDRIYNTEGFSENPIAPIYYYYRKDHLGNNREVWCANTNATVQRTQYYASGLPWASNAGDNPGIQERKYNGKEFVEMHGYDTYDYGARGYYPAMGRFTSVDPLAEKRPWISPYAYCSGNPVNRIDPDGKFDIPKWGDISKSVSNILEQTKKEIKNGIKKVVKQTINGVNSVAKKVTGSNTPPSFRICPSINKNGYCLWLGFSIPAFCIIRICNPPK